jgi:hypothetical protein
MAKMQNVPSPSAIAEAQTQKDISSAKAYVRDRNKWGYCRQDTLSDWAQEKGFTGTVTELLLKKFERPEGTPIVIGEDSVSKQAVYAVWMMEGQPTTEPRFS